MNSSIADPYLFVMLRWATRKAIPLAQFRSLPSFMERVYDDADVRAAIIDEEDSL